MLVYMWMTQLAQPLAGVCMQIAGPGDQGLEMCSYSTEPETAQKDLKSNNGVVEA